MIFLKLLYAMIGIAIGLSILKYRKTVYDWTGKFYWAEKYLWSWGTIVVIMLIGLWLIFLSIAYPLWALDGLTSRQISWQEVTEITQP